MKSEIHKTVTTTITLSELTHTEVYWLKNLIVCSKSLKLPGDMSRDPEKEKNAIIRNTFIHHLHFAERR